MLQGILRKPLRDEIYVELAARIFDRRLPPGTVLRDTELASSLGVSRTPVREALIRLQQDRLVDSDVGRGFRVCELQLSEVQQLYPIIWTLEALALRSSKAFSSAHLEKLRKLNKSLHVAKTAADIVAADDAWHEALLAGCENAELSQMTRLLKARVRRYEVAYMRLGAHVELSMAQHSGIVEALRANSIDKAVSLLVENWRTGMREVENWLSQLIVTE